MVCLCVAFVSVICEVSSCVGFFHIVVFVLMLLLVLSFRFGVVYIQFFGTLFCITFSLRLVTSR